MNSHSRLSLPAALVLIAAPLAAVGLSIAPASAATVSVCASGCDHTTVKDAVAAAQPNDVIEVGAGTFAGEQGIVIDKPLTIVGQGEGTTILDGGGASAGSVPGIFRILPGATSKGSGDIEISDMTLRNPGKNTTATQYFVLSIGVKQLTTGIGEIDLHDLEVHGTGDASKTGYGLYADGGYTGTDRVAPALTITDSVFEDHVNNAIGVDAWRGDVTISGNRVREGINGNSSIVVLNEYTPNRITDPVVVEDNESVGKLVAFQHLDLNKEFGGWESIEVADNRISSITGTDAAIQFFTNVDTATANTGFGTVDVHDNVVRGDGSSTTTVGVLVRGDVATTTVTDNDITRVGAGVQVEPDRIGEEPGAVTVRHNRLFANQHGVRNAADITVDAAENWWGCVRDPKTATDECSGIDNSGSGDVTTAPWVVPTATASDDEVEVGGTLDVDVALDSLSDGSDVVLPDLFVGLETEWSADRGSVSPAAGELSSALQHSATYTAPSTDGPDTIHVSVDRVDVPQIAQAAPAAYGDLTIVGEPVDISLDVAAADDGNGNGNGGSGSGGQGGDSQSAGDLPGTGAPPVGGLLFTAAACLLVGLRMVLGPRSTGGRHL